MNIMLKDVSIKCENFPITQVLVVIVGVYLSKYSDLLQINPFDVGSSGDMIVFKVMRVWLLSSFLFVMLTDFKFLWDIKLIS